MFDTISRWIAAVTTIPLDTDNPVGVGGLAIIGLTIVVFTLEISIGAIVVALWQSIQRQRGKNRIL